MAVRKFDFNKTYEEVEIAGKIYKMEFNDEKLKFYITLIDDFYVKSKKLHEIDADSLEPEEQIKVFGQLSGEVKEVIEAILGPDTYDTLYEQSGNSVMNMIDLVVYLAEIIEEKTKESKAKHKKKYVKKKNNVKSNRKAK